MEIDYIKAVKRSIKSYFMPIYYVFNAGSFLDENGRIFKQEEIQHRLNLIDWVKDVICYNQSEILSFSLNSSHFHKMLRLEFEQEKRNKNKIEKRKEELFKYLNDEFYKVLSMNFAFLSEYYNSKSTSSSPRMCVKGNFKTADIDTVVTIFRDRPVDYNNKTELDNNSGFEHCRNTGSYYLNNDIIKDVAEKKYKNIRLDYNQINSIEGNQKTIRKKLHQNWKSYWKNSDDIENSAYKSTLIVPITLWNNDLSDEFIEKIGAKDTDRLIFGYLCFDHEDEKYFDEDIDVDVGYIIADLISIYAFNRLNYSDYSKSFKEIENFLGKSSSEKFGKQILEEHSKLTASLSSITKFQKDIRSKLHSSNNKLVEIDSILAKISLKEKTDS